jgi:selenide,water dikinase
MGRSGAGVRDLVLVGGGHAHALLLAAFAARPLCDARLTLVSESPEAIYSGMLPGFVAGQYRADEITIDLPRLAASAGARFVEAKALALSAAARTIETADGGLLPYDVASLDVGATVAGLTIPGVTQFALATRPVAALVRALPALLARPAAAPDSFAAIVVGGGAGGIELACALRARLRAEGSRHARVSILEGSPRLLPGRPRAVADAVARRCRALGIAVETGRHVLAVEEGHLQLDDGARVAFDLALWCTGAAPLALLRACSLPLDARGFLRIRSTLQVVGHDALFAVGDVASLEPWPQMPKAGVYAVRAAPILERNLRALLRGLPLREFRPQRDFLTLLNLGEGRALGFKWGGSVEGRLIFRLKDRIDRRFVARFRADTRDRAGGPGRRASAPTQGP